MTDWSKTVNSLYTQFLLRDIAAKVVPGAITLYSANLVTDSIQIGEIPTPVWVLFFAFCWVIGLALQSFGSIRLLETWPQKAEFKGEKLNEKIFQKVTREFRKKEENISQSLIQHERFVVIKEACGNNSIAISISSILFTLAHLETILNPPYLKSIVMVTLVIIIILSLRKLHFDSAKNEWDYICSALESNEKENTNAEKIHSKTIYSYNPPTLASEILAEERPRGKT